MVVDPPASPRSPPNPVTVVTYRLAEWSFKIGPRTLGIALKRGERRKSKGTSGGDEFTDQVLGASFLLLVCNADQVRGSKPVGLDQIVKRPSSRATTHPWSRLHHRVIWVLQPGPKSRSRSASIRSHGIAGD
jgi:hypothetical protein